MNEDNIENITSDNEAIDILNKLYDTIGEEAYSKESIRDELDNSSKKLISCPHEIVFKITANVLEENEKGELIRSKEICTKNYHIPVPIDQDYNVYMKTFFTFLEGCLEKSINHSEEQNG